MRNGWMKTINGNTLIAVIEVMKKWTVTHTIDEIFELAQLMRFPWAPVQSPKEILACTQLKARNFFAKSACPETGSVLKYPGPPYKISGEPILKASPAPSPGEHNELIYRQELGISAKTLKRLYSLKVI